MPLFKWLGVCLLSICATCYLLSAQTPWTSLTLTGNEAKVLEYAPLVSLQITLGLPLQSPDNLYVDFAEFQQLVQNPEYYSQLAETLGGEFVPVDPSGPTTSGYTLEGRILPLPGIRFGMRMGNNFEVQGGANLFRTLWEDEFSVMVFPSNGSQPNTKSGKLKNSYSGILSEVAIAAYLSPGWLKPFIKTGIRGQFGTKTSSDIHLAGHVLPGSPKTFNDVIQPYAGIGLRLMLGSSGLLDLGATFGKLPGSSWAPSLDLGAGFIF